MHKTKKEEPKQLGKMTQSQLIEQRNNLEKAVFEPEEILDPSLIVDAMMHIRNIDFELFKRRKETSIEQMVAKFSKVTIEHLIEQDGEDELFQDSIEKSFLHNELLKRGVQNA